MGLEQEQQDRESQVAGVDVGGLQSLHPVAAAHRGDHVADGEAQPDDHAGGGEHPLRRQAVLADAQGHGIAGQEDKRRQHQRRGPCAPAQHGRARFRRSPS